MRIAIIYDSRGGTTKAAAEAMGERFAERGHQCIVKSVYYADPVSVSEADLVCVGSKTEGPFVLFQHPTRQSMKFIELLELEGKWAVPFCTYKLATGSLLPKMAAALEGRGARVVGRFAFRGPQPGESFSAFVDSLPEPEPAVGAPGSE